MSDSNVSSLQRQRGGVADLLQRLEKVQREQPGLLAEYQNMDRDYGVLRRNYEELLSRLQSANIAQAADTQADKVKLQIVDPPEVAAIARRAEPAAAGVRRPPRGARLRRRDPHSARTA